MIPAAPDNSSFHHPILSHVSSPKIQGFPVGFRVAAAAATAADLTSFPNKCYGRSSSVPEAVLPRSLASMKGSRSPSMTPETVPVL